MESELDFDLGSDDFGLEDGAEVLGYVVGIDSGDVSVGLVGDHTDGVKFATFSLDTDNRDGDTGSLSELSDSFVKVSSLGVVLGI